MPVSDPDVSRPRLIRDGSFLENDWREIAQRRRAHNRLGFAYQVAFVRVLGRFPQQEPLEIAGEILRFAALQLGADPGRALKTEFLLQYMSEPQLRAKVRRGLLKVEQLHALALCSAGITRRQRSYGPVRLPVPAAIPSDGVGTKLHRHWVSLSNAICLPGMPCSLPRWTEPVRVSVASRLVLPSPFPRRVGVHDFAFEACSSFTRVTACRVARPPYSGLCHEASTRPVTRPGRSLATMFTDNYMGGSFPHWQTAPARRTWKFWRYATGTISPRPRSVCKIAGTGE